VEATIKISSLSVDIAGNRILNNLSVDIPTGKIIGLFGPSGSGKTTLIRALVGRQRISHGSVKLLDLPAGSVSLRQDIGYMPQEAAYYTDLTVRQNIDYFASIKGQPKSSVDEIIKTVDLSRQSKQLVETLSGGQRSRVSLAIALLGNPKILFLDEPTVGVDPVLRLQFWELFRKLAGEGVTLIVSSHVMDEARHCDFLLLLRDGEILSYGTPAELKKRTDTNTIEESFLKLVGANK
jgi:ABC-2 type transport system ATP-binding protein